MKKSCISLIRELGGQVVQSCNVISLFAALRCPLPVIAHVQAAIPDTLDFGAPAYVYDCASGKQGRINLTGGPRHHQIWGQFLHAEL